MRRRELGEGVLIVRGTGNALAGLEQSLEARRDRDAEEVLAVGADAPERVPVHRRHTEALEQERLKRARGRAELLGDRRRVTLVVDQAEPATHAADVGKEIERAP